MPAIVTPAPPAVKMKALTIDAYWAWAIAHGTKRVENRGWRTNYRGPLAIHAGLTKKRDRAAIDFIGLWEPESLATDKQILTVRGHVIALCDLVDCVPDGELSDDKWTFGPWCWVLANVRPLREPRPVSGKQGLWNYVPVSGSRGEKCAM